MNYEELRRCVESAHRLITAGAADAAVRLVAVNLRQLDPDREPACPAVIEAAVLYTSLRPDPGWSRYLDRALHQLATAEITPAAGAIVGEPMGHELPAAGFTDRPHLGHRAWSVDLDAAERLHQLGRCGEAVRAATRALSAWTRNPAPPRTLRGLTLMIGLIAMLSACGRDTDARTVLAEHARRLPAPGSPERHTFARYTLSQLDLTSQRHHLVCPAALYPAMATLAADGDDGLPWAQRRAGWWQLLHLEQARP
ncbi:hypothetical protein ACFY36_51185 [Actinoplanes sp. NPDC000266]